MSDSREVQEARALSGMRHAQRFGMQAPAVPGQLASHLIAERLASSDEYGDLHISERGEHRLDKMIHQHVLREHPIKPDDGVL